MPNNTNLIFMVSDPKNWRDASKETEEQYVERRRRGDRIERLWNRRTLFETIQCISTAAAWPYRASSQLLCFVILLSSTVTRDLASPEGLTSPNHRDR